MRFLWVLSAMLAGSVACEKDPALSTSAKTAATAVAPVGSTPNAPAPSNVGAKDPVPGDSDRVVEKHALSPSASQGPSQAGSSATAAPVASPPSDAPKPDDGNGEPMDDVDDAVPATDKSGVDNVVDQGAIKNNAAKDDDDSDGTDIQVEE